MDRASLRPAAALPSRITSPNTAARSGRSPTQSPGAPESAQPARSLGRRTPVPLRRLPAAKRRHLIAARQVADVALAAYRAVVRLQLGDTPLPAQSFEIEDAGRNHHRALTASALRGAKRGGRTARFRSLPTTRSRFLPRPGHRNALNSRRQYHPRGRAGPNGPASRGTKCCPPIR